VSEASQLPPPPARRLVDTDVLSYIVRSDTRAEPYRTYLAGKEIGVRFQTVAELRRWGRTHLWGPSRWQQLQQVLARITVFLVDDALIDAWAYITATRERQGRPIATGDAWIAATAWLQGLPLVTHNRRHFADIEGLDVVAAQQ
jgi:tRNA(fMet)-specific endonuclease VapC